MILGAVFEERFEVALLDRAELLDRDLSVAVEIGVREVLSAEADLSLALGEGVKKEMLCVVAERDGARPSAWEADPFGAGALAFREANGDGEEKFKVDLLCVAALFFSRRAGASSRLRERPGEVDARPIALHRLAGLMRDA